MPASIRTSTPSGAGFGVSTSSKRRSLCACSRQALWVFAIAFIPRRPGQAKREPGPITTNAFFAKIGTTRLAENHGLWLLVLDFAGTTRKIVVGLVAFNLVRQFDHHASAGEIDRGHNGIGERQHHCHATR